jgi:hypothetical protein
MVVLPHCLGPTSATTRLRWSAASTEERAQAWVELNEAIRLRELSPEQLLNLTDALHSLIPLGRPGQPIVRHDAWVKDEPQAFA